MNLNPPRLYLVCGLPGAGKSTRCRQISQATLAVTLYADEWVLGLGQSLVDYGFRIKLQECLLTHACALLQAGVDVVLEFGSWTRAEREWIRRAAEEAGAEVELHFVDAPQGELERRVRARGGPEVESLVQVLTQDWAKFERPLPDEARNFDRFVGPEEDGLR
jgi:predicted kinase